MNWYSIETKKVKSLSIIIFLILIVGVLISKQSLAKSPVKKHGALTVDGNQIVDESGYPVSLAGNSLFWSNNNWGGERFYNKDVIRWLYNDWHSSVIRAAMGVEGLGYLRYPENKQKVETVVEAAIKTGIYVIIDWHTHDVGKYQAEAIDFFKEMASKYGEYNNVIYEIVNEPLKVSWSNDIKPYAESVISAIRVIDPDNLIIVGTPWWSSHVDDASLDPIVGKNIAYSLHFYAGEHKQETRDRALKALNNGIAIFATEYGTVNTNAKGAVDYESVRAWMEFLKKYNISHCNWAVNDKNESASVLVKGAGINGKWSSDDLTESGKLIRGIIREW